jgi:hypothetical protein
MSKFSNGHMNQLGNAMEAAGFTPELVSKLGQSPDVLAKLKRELQVKTKPASAPVAPLLQPIGEPAEFESVEKFVVADEFVLGTGKPFPISFMGDNLKRQLLPLTETAVPKVVLQQRKLLKASVDTPILKELGGEEKARSYMSHIKQFLQAADRSNWYIFYVVDCFDVLCALYVYWYGDGWDLDVYPMSDPLVWFAGYVVVAR